MTMMKKTTVRKKAGSDNRKQALKAASDLAESHGPQQERSPGPDF